MLGLIPFVIAAGAGIGAMFFNSERRKRMNIAWASAANELGLGFRTGAGRKEMPRISGELDGIHVEVAITVTGSGDSKKYWTTYKVRHRNMGPRGELKRQSQLAAVNWFKRTLGNTPYDVIIGDPFFDESIIVNSIHDDEWRLFLTPERRAAVLAVFETWHRAEMHNGHIEVSDAGYCDDADRIVIAVRFLLDVARTLEGQSGAGAALALQEDGRLGEAVDAWRSVNERTDNSFTDLLEGEARVESGDHEGARTVLKNDGEWSLDDVVGGWQSVASRPTPTAASSPAPGSADERSVVNHLFGSDLLSWDVVDRFEAHWLGRTVSWSGTVVSVAPYNNDADFGAGPGVRVVATIGHVDGMRLISNQIDAVVGVSGAPEVRAGQRFSFTGTLSKVDHFARKLYVSDAQVT